MLEIIVPALTFGLLGSFHCLGMCGPLMLSLSFSSNNTKFGNIHLLSGIGRSLYYHLMRIISYATIGVVTGLAGTIMQTAVTQQVLSIVSGVLIILWGINYSKISSVLESKGDVFFSKYFISISKKLNPNNFIELGLLGIINGWLPCGLVYAAAAASLSYGRVDYSVVFMLLFGFGTIPMMVASMFLFSRISIALRKKMNKVIPYALTAMGILFILRGMNLGIPFLSPPMEEFYQRYSMVE